MLYQNSFDTNALQIILKSEPIPEILLTQQNILVNQLKGYTLKNTEKKKRTLDFWNIDKVLLDSIHLSEV